MTLNPVSMAKRVPSLILSIIHYFSLLFACLPVRVSIQQNFQPLALPWSHHFSFSGVGCALVCRVLLIISTLVRIREEHISTFISLTRCLKAEFFKLDLRLNAQQTPESVMAGLNNSEQFLWRPWGKGFIQGILKPSKGSLPRIEKNISLGPFPKWGDPLAHHIGFDTFLDLKRLPKLACRGGPHCPN